VDFTELNSQQLMIAAALAGFVVGSVVIRIFTRVPVQDTTNEDPRNHKIRELEADLRTLKRESEDNSDDLKDKESEFNTAVESLQELRSTLAERDATIAELQVDQKSSVVKIRELRHELQDRATETVRNHVRAEEAETELDVARAGSEAVLSEIVRLQEERKHLTDTVETLGNHFLPDEELFDKD
jgi:predicted  nucleic acid-binding Zn-ribbon protein